MRDTMAMLRRNDRTAWRRVENEVLIISSDSNTLTVLNDTGARVWELLDSPASVDALAVAIADEFEVDEPSARRDIESFVADLSKRRLIVVEEA